MFGGFLLLGRARRRPVRTAPAVPRRRDRCSPRASLLDGLAPSANTLGHRPRPAGPRRARSVSPAALSSVTTTFADGKPRTKAMGVWAGDRCRRGALGLLLGGILTEYASWRWIFFVTSRSASSRSCWRRRFVPESRVDRALGGFDAHRRRRRHRGADPARHRHRQGAGLRLGLPGRRSASWPPPPCCSGRSS